MGLTFVEKNPLAGIRQLASQTLWYGLSNIFGRFINYLLTPILTYIYAASDYGDISILFAIAAFLNIFYTYGMETSYFRFNKDGNERNVLNSSMSILLITTLLYSALLILPVQSIAAALKMENHPEWLIMVIAIVAIDTLTVIPFAKLRNENRPRKFALIKIINILTNMFFVVFFLYWCKGAYEAGNKGFLSNLYLPQLGIGYVFIANLIASGLTLILLSKEWGGFQFQIQGELIRSMLVYSTPLIIVGFGGIINETIDRFMILWRYDGTEVAARTANGIYSANYKLSVMIVLFIQTFRMGAEPFFFKQSSSADAPATYARVMRLFIVVCCACFLLVVLFLDAWKYFMGIGMHPEYAEGLLIVPVLMLAKIFLGIYYNLSIWYKLTNRTSTGALITLIGAAITIALNYVLIPIYGYWGCAMATLGCYGSMMVISYAMGQRHYPVPYNLSNAFLHIGLAVGLFSIQFVLRQSGIETIWLHVTGALLLLCYLVLVLTIEKKELKHVPLLNKIYR